MAFQSEIQILLQWVLPERAQAALGFPSFPCINGYIHVCAHAHGMCVCADTGAWVCMEKPEVNAFLNHSLSYFLRQGLSPNLEFTYSALWLVSEFQEPLCLHLQLWSTFYMGLQDMISAPHPCVARTLNNSACLRPWISFHPPSPEVHRQRTKDTVLRETSSKLLTSVKLKVKLQSKSPSPLVHLER